MYKLMGNVWGPLIIVCLITFHHATPHNGYIMYGDALEKRGGGGGGGGGGGAMFGFLEVIKKLLRKEIQGLSIGFACGKRTKIPHFSKLLQRQLEALFQLIEWEKFHLPLLSLCWANGSCH